MGKKWMGGVQLFKRDALAEDFAHILDFFGDIFEVHFNLKIVLLF